METCELCGKESNYIRDYDGIEMCINCESHLRHEHEDYQM